MQKVESMTNETEIPGAGHNSERFDGDPHTVVY